MKNKIAKAAFLIAKTPLWKIQQATINASMY